MIIEIPYNFVIVVKWCIMVGLTAIAVAFAIAGIAIFYESRHKSMEIYNRSLIMWHLVWKKNDDIKRKSKAELSRALKMYLEECPEDCARFDSIIFKATGKVKS